MILRLGSNGAEVSRWQEFLNGNGYFWIETTGVFDQETMLATKSFQEEMGLTSDGVVGPNTLEKAKLPGEVSSPTKPTWTPYNSVQTANLFGPLPYKANPSQNFPESILVDSNWIKKNIRRVQVPQFSKRKFSSSVMIHEKVVSQFLAFWKAVDDAGLLSRVLSFDGAWVARFVRGSRTVLSNHSYGTAFDINAKWNPLGAKPAPLGSTGCVLELIDIAQELGWYWGGWFNRVDGMHFQMGKLQDP